MASVIISVMDMGPIFFVFRRKSFDTMVLPFFHRINKPQVVFICTKKILTLKNEQEADSKLS